jgi:hypothetical protein
MVGQFCAALRQHRQAENTGKPPVAHLPAVLAVPCCCTSFLLTTWSRPCRGCHHRSSWAAQRTSATGSGGQGGGRRPAAQPALNRRKPQHVCRLSLLGGSHSHCASPGGEPAAAG